MNRDHVSPALGAATKQIMTLEEAPQTGYSEKHRYQVNNLISILEQNKLLHELYVYVEFGAGKGLLSSEIALKFRAQQKTSKHILLEISGRQNKCDKLHRQNPFYLRFRTDILDFNMNKIPQILADKGLDKSETAALSVVGISKHMCGYATDISVKALLNCEDKASCHFHGMMIATCCHHKCNAENYLNTQFLLDLGFKQDEVQYLFNFSSWAICNFGKILDDESEQEDEEEQKAAETHQSDAPDTIEKKNQELAPGEHQDTALSQAQKEEIGTKVKRILDLGRVMFLRSKGLPSSLQKYCSPKFSPENFVVIVSP